MIQQPQPQQQPQQQQEQQQHMQQLLLSVENLSGVLRQSHGELLEVCNALCTPTPSVESQRHAACLGRAVGLLDAQSELSRAVLAVLAQRDNLVAAPAPAAAGEAPRFTPSSHPRRGSVDQLLHVNNGSGRPQRPTPPMATSSIDANSWMRVDAIVKPPGAPPAEYVTAVVITDESQQASPHSSPFGSRKGGLSGRRRARPSSESHCGADGSFSSASSVSSGSPWLAPAADAATAAPRLATIASYSCGEASIPFGDEVPQPHRPPSAVAAVLAELRMGPPLESSPLPPSPLRAGHSRPYTERGGCARSILAQNVSLSAPGSASASREPSPHMGGPSSLRRLSPSIFRSSSLRRSSSLQRHEGRVEAEGGREAGALRRSGAPRRSGSAPALRRSSEPEPSLKPLSRDSSSKPRRRRRTANPVGTASWLYRHGPTAPSTSPSSHASPRPSGLVRASLRASLRASTSRSSGIEVAAPVPRTELGLTSPGEVGGAEAGREEKEPAGTKRRDSKRKPSSSSSTAAATTAAVAKSGVGGGLTEEVPFPAEGEEAAVAAQLRSALGAQHAAVPQARPRTVHPRTAHLRTARTLAPYNLAPCTLAPSHLRALTLVPTGCAGARGALNAVPEPPQGGDVGLQRAGGSRARARVARRHRHR